jgi:methylaspartate mutase sigma subunit
VGSVIGVAVPLRHVSKYRLVIGMTESDCHTVPIYLLKLFLEERNVEVLNLGACVSLDRMFTAARDFGAQAIVFGAQNGHAFDDLMGLLACKTRYGLSCPVFLGGNLTVGAEKEPDTAEAFRKIGVDYIVSSFDGLLSIFLRLSSSQERETGTAETLTLAQLSVDAVLGPVAAGV